MKSTQRKAPEVYSVCGAGNLSLALTYKVCEYWILCKPLVLYSGEPSPPIVRSTPYTLMNSAVSLDCLLLCGASAPGIEHVDARTKRQGINVLRTP